MRSPPVDKFCITKNDKLYLYKGKRCKGVQNLIGYNPKIWSHRIHNYNGFDLPKKQIGDLDCLLNWSKQLRLPFRDIAHEYEILKRDFKLVRVDFDAFWILSDDIVHDGELQPPCYFNFGKILFRVDLYRPDLVLARPGGGNTIVGTDLSPIHGHVYVGENNKYEDIPMQMHICTGYSGEEDYLTDQYVNTVVRGDLSSAVNQIISLLKREPHIRGVANKYNVCQSCRRAYVYDGRLCERCR